MTRGHTKFAVLPAVVALAVTLFPRCAPAQDFLPHHPVWTIPPTLWATEWDRGPIRVAFVVPVDASPDVAGLVGRAALTARIETFDPADDATIQAALDGAFKSKLESLVIAGVDPARLSNDVQSLLRGWVDEGGGIVSIEFERGTGETFPDMLHLAPANVDLTIGVGLQSLSNAPGRIESFSNAEGRLAAIRFPLPRNRGEAFGSSQLAESPADFENVYSLILRAIRWTAHREPNAAIRSLEVQAESAPQQNEVPPQLTRQFVETMQQGLNPALLREFRLELSAPAPSSYRVRFQLRYPGRAIQWGFTAEEEIRKGMSSVSASVPSGSGEYYLDAWIVNKKGERERVVDWYTAQIDLPGHPRISDVRFSPGVLAPNDRLRVSLDIHEDSRGLVSTVAGKAGPDNAATVIARIIDAYGRVAALRSVPAHGGLKQFGIDVPVADWIGPYARAEIYVTNGFNEDASWWLRQSASYAAVDLFVRQGRPQGLEWIADAPGDAGRWARDVRQQLVRAGVQRVSAGSEATDTSIAADGLARLVRLPAPNLGNTRDAPTLTADTANALRLAAMDHAALRPGLYVVPWERGIDDADATAAFRMGAEMIVRESDPNALVALDEVDSGAGFRVVPADPARLAAAMSAHAEYLAVRADWVADESAAARAKWWPWLAASYGAHGLWTSGVDYTSIAWDDPEDPFVALSDAMRDVRAGFDTLFHMGGGAAPMPIGDSRPEISGLSLPEDFRGLVRDMPFGAARVVFVLAEPTSDRKRSAIKFEVDKNEYLYTPLNVPEYPTRRASVRLEPGDAAVFVTLPYEMSRIVLDVPARGQPGQRLEILATVKTKGALPGTHLLHVRVLDPSGRELMLYGRTIIARDGLGATYIPLAYNDLPGDYTVIVRDVLSGVEAVGTVEVI